MKKLIQLILRFLGRQKVADLDNDGKIETLKEEVQGLFSQFNRMHSHLGEVNEKLDKVIEEEKFVQNVERDQLERIIEQAEARIAESESRVDRANKEKETNNKLQEKVSDFLV